jgi:hypothetical protein
LGLDGNGVNLEVYLKGTQMYALWIRVLCPHHDWQVYSAAQIIGVLGPLFPSVVNLTLTCGERTLPSEWHTDDADSTQWREVLKSFNNVRTLHVPEGLIKELSGSLQMHDGESPMELLPELEELRCNTGRGPSNAFVPFLDLRRNAGRPFVLVPIPPPRIQTTGSWATWQVQPGMEYTPPSSEPSIRLPPESPPSHRGLFGPRSPRSSF